MKKRHETKWYITLLIIFGALLLSVLIGYLPTLISLEYDLLDYRFQLRGQQDVSDSPIVILALDDQSDESTPERWPWPREYFAHVIENLNEAGVKAIGVDVIFEQADVHGPDSDDRFAQVLRDNPNVVISGKLTRPQGKFDITTLVTPYQKFTRAGNAWGLVSTELDEDGFYRRYLVGQAFNDSIYGSFVAEVLKIYDGMDPNTSVEDLPESFRIGDYVIPKINSYSMMINYAGPAHTFPTYSFDAVLDDEDFDLLEMYDLDAFDDPGDPELGLPPGLLYSGVLKDKIVLIGSTMQELHDDFPTPFLEVVGDDGKRFKALTPGVEIHASALHTILNRDFLEHVSGFVSLFVLLLLGFLVWLQSRYLHVGISMVGSVILAVAYFALAVWMFTGHNLILEIAVPTLMIFLSYTGHTVYHYILSQNEKKMIRGAFMHYVPEKVVAEIIENPDKLQLGGEERVVSVLFSDVAGFTSISEKLSPKELVHLLNEYLTDMTDIVLKNKGIIDKYEGDAIMAEFGVPVSYDNHAEMACAAALEMQRRLKVMREKWRKENRPALTARIGINTGEVIVGNMGSKNVFDYTVMGDHVNLGSRLEGANKFYGTKIMISEFTYEHVKDKFHTRELDLIAVKGKARPIKVYELIAFKNEELVDQFKIMLDHYNHGIEFYQRREWEAALNSFEQGLVAIPNDLPSQEYRRRCIEYKFNEPSADWNGVTVMKEK
jgi:adenylate cyclase